MDRKDLLQSKGYWITTLQIAIYNCAMQFMAEHNMNRTQLAQHLGVTKGYVTQLLNGDFDHRLSKLVELALAFGYVPEINLTPIQKYIAKDEIQIRKKRKENVAYANNNYKLTSIKKLNKEEEWYPNQGLIKAA